MSTIYEESLKFHENPPGKIGTAVIKPMTNQYELSLAYSPGVAAVCRAIYENPDDVYKYTSKANSVAIISNGTAILGLGDLGTFAAKPVMEGKAALLKLFADVDATNVEVDSKDTDKIIDVVKHIGRSYGGINLEDIRGPECFVIEKTLQEILDIPVFHDDQHGTAIIVSAVLINAQELVNKKIPDMKVVVNGAGAAGLATATLLTKLGIQKNNLFVCDKEGVIYEGRNDSSMNPWKEKFANKTEKRTLSEAMDGADVFIGLSVKDAVSQDMVKKMAANPIILALANPDPEITPTAVREVRDDAIVGTGRSDYNNQVNNVMCFPYIFRGALDCQAREINDEMKLAAARAIAALAKEPPNNSIKKAYANKNCSFGREYVIPVPFDSRLIEWVSSAVAQAAMDTGVARVKIDDMIGYRRRLAARRNREINLTYKFYNTARKNPRKIIFAEGEETAVIHAAIKWRDDGCGEPILVGREDVIEEKMKEIGCNSDIKILNAGSIGDISKYIEHLCSRLERNGYLRRDCERLIKHDRNVFAAELLINGYANGMVTGLTRSYHDTLSAIRHVVDVANNEIDFGMSMLIKKDRAIFISDTSIHEDPSSEELAQIAINSARYAATLGYSPRVAIVSASSFGESHSKNAEKMRKVMEILRSEKRDFEFEGEISPDIALNIARGHELYPFMNLSAPANVLIMPSMESASIAVNVMREFANITTIGSILCGLKSSVEIVSNGADTNEVFNAALIASAKVNTNELS